MSAFHTLKSTSICNSAWYLIHYHYLTKLLLSIPQQDADKVAERVNHYGGLFIGQHTAEVFGDYGVGPNHTLPTGQTARYTGG